MKKNYTLTFFSLSLFVSFAVKAQYIPDERFADAIAEICPTCIDGNHYLTADALTLTSLALNYDSIADMTGVDGFSNLESLNCSVNIINNLPALPPNLKELYCEWNKLHSLPALPATLKTLSCRGNAYLKILPALPDSLQTLICYYDSIGILPELPASLVTLGCGANPLYIEPTLPEGLKFINYSQTKLNWITPPSGMLHIECGDNNAYLTNISSLPPNLRYLGCNGNEMPSLPSLPESLDTLKADYDEYLTSLPPLPDGLVYLECSGDYVSSLTSLPSSLQYLSCEFTSDNTFLPSLPSHLKFFDCSGGALNSLPALPDSLQTLDCSFSEITELPPLPPALTYLQCTENYITSLPSLPDHLGMLYAGYNHLTELPPLPQYLTWLDVHQNAITTIPDLPPHLFGLLIGYNPISCLPFLPDTLFALGVDSTNITCLPNLANFYNYYNLPVCSMGNSNGCAVFPQVGGKIFFDSNENGIWDSTESAAQGIVVTAKVSNLVGISDSYGNYTVALPFNTTDTIAIPGFSSYYTPPDTFYTVSFDTALQMISGKDFGVLPLNIGSDVMVTIENGAARPGFETGAWATIQNIGTETVDGTLTLTFDPTLSYFSSSDTPASIIGNQVTWNFDSLQAVHSRSFFLILMCPQNAQIGSSLYDEATATLTSATDINLTDNFCVDSSLVISSYDPNEKEVDDSIITTGQISGGKYLEYTIHFQNTGTAPATFIYVIDTLSSNLDASTFQMISTSHPYTITLSNDLTKASQPAYVKWLFNSINLPDSSVDFVGSQGFVKFRIRVKGGTTDGESVTNQASIYFDYNDPVATNTTHSSVVFEESVPSVFSSLFDAALFPNPAGDQARINFSSSREMEITITLVDARNAVLTEKDIRIPAGQSSTDLPLSMLSSGIYFVRIKSSLCELHVLKVIKEE